MIYGYGSSLKTHQNTTKYLFGYIIFIIINGNELLWSFKEPTFHYLPCPRHCGTEYSDFIFRLPNRIFWSNTYFHSFSSGILVTCSPPHVLSFSLFPPLFFNRLKNKNEKPET